MEAEYVALSTAMKELIPLKRIVIAIALGLNFDKEIMGTIALGG